MRRPPRLSLTEACTMLIIDCPYCGRRPELEFTYGGQAHVARPPDPSQVDDEAWGAFLYLRSNTRGVHPERWRHTHGCGRFFNALRDTTTDQFFATYRCGEMAPALVAPAADPERMR
jgi:sarcosine oxidase subunit delta